MGSHIIQFNKILYERNSIYKFLYSKSTMKIWVYLFRDRHQPVHLLFLDTISEQQLLKNKIRSCVSELFIKRFIWWLMYYYIVLGINRLHKLFVSVVHAVVRVEMKF